MIFTFCEIEVKGFFKEAEEYFQNWKLSGHQVLAIECLKYFMYLEISPAVSYCLHRLHKNEYKEECSGNWSFCIVLLYIF